MKRIKLLRISLIAENEINNLGPMQVYIHDHNLQPIPVI